MAMTPQNLEVFTKTMLESHKRLMKLCESVHGDQARATCESGLAITHALTTLVVTLDMVGDQIEAALRELEKQN